MQNFHGRPAKRGGTALGRADERGCGDALPLLIWNGGVCHQEGKSRGTSAYFGGFSDLFVDGL
ncbi:hypothetical protein [Caproicibacter fermentans]|uniref:Uncharacterized protein n=1 Tax=Caproicibacter fermentans TaxID=2576756 RepID=A0A7G8T6R0_9FIRM|nr:hypothetical protein [Caproicibacter fermentans]QNK39301.1 hypothetical protein HCR03_11065 [Caproicibacter fermentans]